MVKSISPVLYKIQGRKRTEIVHHDLIKLCNSKEIPLWLRKAQNKFFLVSGLVENESVEDEVGLHSLFQANSSIYTTDAAFAAQVEPRIEHVATENMALAEKVDPLGTSQGVVD